MWERGVSYFLMIQVKVWNWRKRDAQSIAVVPDILGPLLAASGASLGTPFVRHLRAGGRMGRVVVVTTVRETKLFSVANRDCSCKWMYLLQAKRCWIEGEVLLAVLAMNKGEPVAAPGDSRSTGVV
jgi:hypothetical protein